MRKTLLITVRKALRKRHVKDILGCVDSSQKISDTSVTGSSAACPVSLQTETRQLTQSVHIQCNSMRTKSYVCYLIPTSCPVRIIHSREVWMKCSNSWFWAWTEVIRGKSQMTFHFGDTFRSWLPTSWHCVRACVWMSTLFLFFKWLGQCYYIANLQFVM